MVDPKLIEVLRRICIQLKETRVNWALTGSLSFWLQGVPVEWVNDIDLQSDRDGAYEIERHLHEYITHPVVFSTKGLVRSHYGRLLIDGITVEIIGDIEKRRPDGSWEPPPDLAAYKYLVEFDGMPIPVLSLAYEAVAYAKMGRHRRAQQLTNWLRGSSKRRAAEGKPFPKY